MTDLTRLVLSVASIPQTYLDPGSGSFLIQLLIAGIAGLGIFIGASWSRVKRFFRGKLNKPEVDDDIETDEGYDD